MSDPSSFLPMTAMFWITGIWSQSCISILVFSTSDVCSDLPLEVDGTVCTGDTILHNKRQHSDDKLLHSRSLHQSVRESEVGLLRCTGSGDVTVYLDNFTFLLPLCDTSFQSRTGNLVFDLLLGRVPLVNFLTSTNLTFSGPSSFLFSIE